MSFWGIKKGVKFDRKWQLTSRLVRKLQGSCQVCGKTEYLQVHHLIGRRTQSTKYYLPNLITLCPSHHTMSSDFSAHMTPKDFRQWFKNKFPEEMKLVHLRQATRMNTWEVEKMYEIEILPLLKKYAIK